MSFQSGKYFFFSVEHKITYLKKMFMIFKPYNGVQNKYFRKSYFLLFCSEEIK